jgi:NAD(P)-dependent dehydrogenase (short-subunit alcohol dehydrogenase family)
MSQSWFITGANRGIGFEIVKIAASQGYTVFAGARNPANASALNQLAAQYPDIHVVKLASGSASDAEAAATVVEHTTGSLDVIVANAGIADNWQQILSIANLLAALFCESFTFLPFFCWLIISN